MAQQWFDWWHSFQAGWATGGKDAVSPSEVLLVEALAVARQQNWPLYARDLVHHRLRSHVGALVAALRAERRFGRSPDVMHQLLVALRFCRTERVTAIRKIHALPLEDRMVDRYGAECQRHLDNFSTLIRGLPRETLDDIDSSLVLAHREMVVGGSVRRPESQSGRNIQDQDVHEHAFVGLALSGGGIRSASFSIGVIQGLASQGLLPAFHYISSVSGGGYAASWLAAWAYRHRHGVEGVQKELYSPGALESGPIWWVRRYSSYLAPRPGSVLSADAWSLFVAYVSNWLPILALVICATSAMLLTPHLLASLAGGLEQVGRESDGGRIAIVTTAVLALLAVSGLVRRLVMFYREPGKRARHPAGLAWLVTWGSVICSVWVAMAMPVVADAMSRTGILRASGPVLLMLAFAAWTSLMLAASALALLLGSSVGQRCVNWTRAHVMKVVTDDGGPLVLHPAGLGKRALNFLLSAIIAVALLRLLMTTGAESRHDVRVLISVGPLALVIVCAVAEIFGMLFARREYREMDRAWLARLGGWLLSGAFIWMLLSGFVFGVDLALNPVLDTRGHVLEALAVLAIATAALLRIRDGTAAYTLVAAALFVCLVHFLITPLLAETAGADRRPLVVAWAVLVAATVALGAAVDVNRFSLHSLYKEGLVRTFLGASRLGRRNVAVAPPAKPHPQEASQFAARRPDPVTNIDDDDNPALAWLRSRDDRSIPLLLLNAAVNGRSTTDTDGRAPRQWPYVFSPYFCGSPATGIGFRPTEQVLPEAGAKGLTLGTAMAVSGAAMSPTSGRSTHPIRAFLLGVLNARLGLWIENPTVDHRGRGTSAIRKLSGLRVLREILGERAKVSHWIHLSDGGHFENLGIHELVRRGCRRIVAVDASCDPNRIFSDLANAIRRIQIDLGVRITRERPWEIFGRDGVDARSTAAPVARSWTWFEIDYGDRLPRGRLLYIKPTVYADQPLPVAVMQYLKDSSSFPHESTADQFFSEAQLEAYRALGQTCAKDALKAAMAPSDPVGNDQDPNLAAIFLRFLKKHTVL